MKLSENPNVKKLIDNAFKLGKEQAEKEFRELIDDFFKEKGWDNLREELKNKIGGKDEKVSSV